MSQIVKQGLLHCGSHVHDCKKCPFYTTAPAFSVECINALATDSLAYIETLEQRLDKATKLLRRIGKYECPPNSPGCEGEDCDCDACWEAQIKEAQG